MFYFVVDEGKHLLKEIQKKIKEDRIEGF